MSIETQARQIALDVYPDETSGCHILLRSQIEKVIRENVELSGGIKYCPYHFENNRLRHAYVEGDATLAAVCEGCGVKLRWDRADMQQSPHGRKMYHMDGFKVGEVSPAVRYTPEIEQTIKDTMSGERSNVEYKGDIPGCPGYHVVEYSPLHPPTAVRTEDVPKGLLESKNVRVREDGRLEVVGQSWTCDNHPPGLEISDIPRGEKCPVCGRGEER